jgi:hypothetical protein
MASLDIPGWIGRQFCDRDGWRQILRGAERNQRE